MVEAGVLIGEGRRPVRIARRQARPQLGADRRTLATGEPVVEAASVRRHEPFGPVPLADAVLVPGKTHMPLPRSRQRHPLDAGPLLRGQHAGEHHLQVEVVVRHHLARHGIVEVEVE